MFGMDSQRPAAPTLPPGAAHRNVNDEVHGRLDRRKTATAAIKSGSTIGKASPMPAGGRVLKCGVEYPQPKPAARQGKLKLVPDDK